MSLPPSMAAAAIAAGVLGTPGSAPSLSSSSPVWEGGQPGELASSTDHRNELEQLGWTTTGRVGDGRAPGLERVLAPVAGQRPIAPPALSSGTGRAPGWPAGRLITAPGSASGSSAPGAAAGFGGALSSAPPGVFRADVGRPVAAGELLPASPAGQPESEGENSEAEAAEQDVERLADEVFDLLRWRLAAERERPMG